MRRIMHKKVVVFAAIAVLAVAGAGIAAWILTATGDGAGKTATVVAPTVSPGTPTGDAYPSSSATGSLSYSIANPNTIALKITQLDQAGNITTSSAACPASFFAIAPKAGLSISVPTGTSQVTIPNAYQLVASAPTECMGVLVTIPTLLTFSTNGS